MTAAAILQDVPEAHMYMIGTGPDYTNGCVPTDPTAALRELLVRLGLDHLVDREHLTSSVVPRAAR